MSLLTVQRNQPSFFSPFEPPVVSSQQLICAKHYFIKMLSLLNLWSQIMVTFLGYLFLFQSSQAVGIIWHCKDPPDNLSM